MRKSIITFAILISFITPPSYGSLGSTAAQSVSENTVKSTQGYFARMKGFFNRKKAHGPPISKFGDPYIPINPTSETGVVFFQNFDDLNLEALKGSFGTTIVRERTVRSVRDKLTISKYPNVVLVSKTPEEAEKVIEALVQRTVNGDVPYELKNTRFIEWKHEQSMSASNAQLVGGVQGNVDKAFKAVDSIIEQIKASGLEGKGQEDIVIVIRNFNEILTSKTSNEQDTIVSYIQKRFNNEFKAEKRDIRFLVTISDDGYEEYMSHHFTKKYFQVVKAEEFTYTEVVDSLIRNKARLGIDVEDELIERTVVLVSKYYRNDPLLEKSEQIISMIKRRAMNTVYDTPIELEELPAKIRALELELGNYKATFEKTGRSNQSMKAKIQKLEEDLASKKSRRESLTREWELKKELFDELKVTEGAWKRANSANLKHLKSYQELAAKNAGKLDARTKAKMDAISEKLGNEERAAFELYEESLNKVSSIDGINRVQFDETDVARIISEDTGVPVANILKSDIEKLRVLISEIEAAGFRGQTNAIIELYETLKVIGTDDATLKTAGLLLLNGPSGTGKTFLTEILAKVTGRHPLKVAGAGLTKDRLEKELGEKLALNPYALVNIDEIETAGPGALDLLLFIQDQGYFIYKGKRIDCSNTLFFTTSNIGYQLPADTIEKNFGGLVTQEQRRIFIQTVDKRMEPRLVNRYNTIIQFTNHTLESTSQMIDDAVERAIDYYFKLGINLEVTPKYKAYLTRLSMDSSKGARTTADVIKTNLYSPVNEARIRGTLKDQSGDTFKLDVDGPEQLGLGL